MNQVRGLEVQYSNSVVTLVNPEGEYLYASGQVFENGIEASEKVGRSFMDYLHPDDIQRINRAMQEALICDMSVEIRVRVRTNDGYGLINRVSQRLIDKESGQIYVINVATKVE
jgi:PAS domain S-box-containing protein